MNKIIKLDTAPQRYDKILKIALVGDSKVGKTSFLKKFLDNKFSDDYNSTVGSETKNFCCSYKNKNIKFQICDIAGIEKYKPSLTTFYKGINGVIIMFDVNNIDSFINIEYWFKEVNKYKMQDVPIVFVGNKSDIIDNIISDDIGNELTESLGFPYIKISVKNNLNLDTVFEHFLIDNDSLDCNARKD
jgi:small GTP-binding protein